MKTNTIELKKDLTSPHSREKIWVEFSKVLPPSLPIGDFSSAIEDASNNGIHNIVVKPVFEGGETGIKITGYVLENDEQFAKRQAHLALVAQRRKDDKEASKKLRPCPFCAGAANFHHAPSGHLEISHYPEAGVTCPARIEHVCDTYEQGERWWNDRRELTLDMSSDRVIA